MTSLHRVLTRMTAALALAAAALTACGPSNPPQAREDQARTEPTDAGGATAATDLSGGPVEAAAPSADAEILHNVFEFPGQPQVLWTEEPLGTPDEGRSVPGPTDYAYDAVLDYGDPAAVAELVTGLTPVPSLLSDVPAWYPPAVAEAAEGAGVAVDVYTGVPGFGPQQEVAVVNKEPRYVLLSRITS